MTAGKGIRPAPDPLDALGLGYLRPAELTVEILCQLGKTGVVGGAEDVHRGPGF